MLFRPWNSYPNKDSVVNLDLTPDSESRFLMTKNRKNLILIVLNNTIKLQKMLPAQRENPASKIPPHFFLVGHFCFLDPNLDPNSEPNPDPQTPN
jgi:hypothetical protein